jgi:hypothetical protein
VEVHDGVVVVVVTLSDQVRKFLARARHGGYVELTAQLDDGVDTLAARRCGQVHDSSGAG